MSTTPRRARARTPGAKTPNPRRTERGRDRLAHEALERVDPEYANYTEVDEAVVRYSRAVTYEAAEQGLEATAPLCRRLAAGARLTRAERKQLSAANEAALIVITQMLWTGQPLPVWAQALLAGGLGAWLRGVTPTLDEAFAVHPRTKAQTAKLRNETFAKHWVYDWMVAENAKGRPLDAGLYEDAAKAVGQNFPRVRISGATAKRWYEQRDKLEESFRARCIERATREIVDAQDPAPM